MRIRPEVVGKDKKRKFSIYGYKIKEISQKRSSFFKEQIRKLISKIKELINKLISS